MLRLIRCINRLTPGVCYGSPVRWFPVSLALALSFLLGAGVWVSQARPLFSLHSSAHTYTEAFLEAESEKDPATALMKWKALLEQVKQHPSQELPAFMARPILERIVIDRYVELYRQENNKEVAKVAYAYISHLPDTTLRLWGLVELLHCFTQADIGSDAELLRYVQDMNDTIYYDAMQAQPQTRERLLYSLAMILTSPEGQRLFDTNALRRVHALMTHLVNPSHRQEILHRFAMLSDHFGTSVYPASFQPLYTAFNQISPPASKLLALHRDALARNHFSAALYALLGIEEEKTRTRQLKVFFKNLMQEGAYSRARRVAEQTDNRSACVYMWSDLSRHYLFYGYGKQAKTAQANATNCAYAIDNPSSRKKALALIENRQKEGMRKRSSLTEPDAAAWAKLKATIDAAWEKQGVQEAANILRRTEPALLRVQGFHYLAKKQAASLDSYALLRPKPGNDKRLTETVSYRLASLTTRPVTPQAQEVNAQETVLRKKYADPSNIVISEQDASSIGQVFHFNALPQQVDITGKDLRDAIPLPQGGRIGLSHYESNIFNSTFRHLLGNSGFVLSQQSAVPLVITLEDGVMDLADVYDVLIDMGNTRCLVKEEKIYTLHCPLIVGEGATLVLSGDHISELRLSTRSGSYLLNANSVYISDIKLTGWDDERNQPLWLDYKQKHQFRPFFNSWNRSYSYIGNSEITALGYDNGKSYGVSFSSGPNNWQALGDIDHNERPTGTIVNNSFNNLLFGFYSYEAYNAVLVGNEYRDNIVYGIDPHDRSTHLVMAYNTTYGSRKKHGIIISREVSHSLIAGNLSFDNRGSGIMLDRESSGTLIYANSAFANDQEGLAVFESNCNIVAANWFWQNDGSGIRVRNSFDVGIFYNQIGHNYKGIDAYTLKLENDPSHDHRNFQLDPYADITTFSAVGNLIEANETGIIINAIDGMFLKGNHYRKQEPEMFRGDWFALRLPDIMHKDRKSKGVAISRICPNTKSMPRHHSCTFRENASLRGDGQDYLLTRILQPLCQSQEAQTARSEVPQ